MSTHEPHNDVLSFAISATATTMLTLLVMLGGSAALTLNLKALYDSQLVILELALVARVSRIITRRDSHKRVLSTLMRFS